MKLEADDVFVVDAELRPAPASLDLGVDVPDGVGVYVDGAYMATTPLAEPLRIEGGPHDVVVAANGREPFETRIALERGEFRLLKPHLPVTGQRIGAIAALVAGGLGIGTSIGTGLAGQAGTFDDATKDTLFRVSTGTGVAGFLLSFVGGALFVFDAPDVDVVSGPGDAGVGARARF
ncbi:MAG: PEGA domain-containing protein [Myxococcota bacterium]